MSSVSFDEYLVLEAASDTKHEWIDGLIYAMSRGTPEHGRLSAAIMRALPQSNECRVYSSDTLIHIENAHHSTYVDASIVCGAILTRGAKDKNGKSLGEAIANPRVVVEVLSKSTEHRDRGGRSWVTETRGGGETITIHGLAIAVDAIYA